MKTRIKEEIGHEYGPLKVIAYTNVREPSNGCVKWKCVCTICGATDIRNGNNLRFSKHITCKHCRNGR